MGNSHRITHEDQTNIEIVKQKQEIRFEQGDFIRQIEGSLEHEYDILSPPMRKNQFYELRKIIHLRTRLTKSAFIINKYKVHTEQRELLQTQIAKLKKIDNPFLLKIYELYKDSHRFYIVCEFCEGHSLARILEEEGAISEKKTAIIMHQLLHVLNDCHQHNIIHSDMKLQNISFNSKKQNVIKVSDFKFKISLISHTGRHFLLPHKLSLDNLALNRIYGPVASFSIFCGPVSYLFLDPHQKNQNKNQCIVLTIDKIDQLNINHDRFGMISKQGKQLLKTMLKYDKAERPTALECLKHPWFKKFYKPPKISQLALKRTLVECFNFNASSKLQQATWNFYVTVIVSFEEKQSILEVFQNLDKECRGYLSEEDLYKGFLKVCDKRRAAFCSSFIAKRYNNRGIKFSQFVSLSTSRSFLINEINNQKIFNIFDEDKSGQISVSELKAVLGASKQVSEDIWLELMKEADENADGQISFEEFHHLMNDLKNVCNQDLVEDSLLMETDGS